MSAAALPAFSGDHPPCVKCGIRDAYTQYVPPRQPVYERGRVLITYRDEFLKRTCSRCSYEWAEACVPARQTST